MCYYMTSLGQNELQKHTQKQIYAGMNYISILVASEIPLRT